jgi:hypothetical protein
MGIVGCTVLINELAHLTARDLEVNGVDIFDNHEDRKNVIKVDRGIAAIRP